MLARGCDVVTLEIEQISEHSMASAATFCPVRPGGAHARHHPGPHRAEELARASTASPSATSAPSARFDQLREAIAALGGRCFCKSATGGYDGRGQGKVGFGPEPRRSERSRSPRRMGSPRRRPRRRRKGHRPRTRDQRHGRAQPPRRGQGLSRRLEPPRKPDPRLERHPRANPCRNGSRSPQDRRRNRRHLPARRPARGRDVRHHATANCSSTSSPRARTTATTRASAPASPASSSRPSAPSATFRSAMSTSSNPPPSPTCSATSGSTPTAPQRTPAFDKALAVPGVRLHLYEKLKPRKGRKMGHLSAVGATSEEAVERVLQAKAAL